jgi:hypothetical protein
MPVVRKVTLNLLGSRWNPHAQKIPIDPQDRNFRAIDPRMPARMKTLGCDEQGVAIRFKCECQAAGAIVDSFHL